MIASEVAISRSACPIIGTVEACRRRYEASIPTVLNDPASGSGPRPWESSAPRCFSQACASNRIATTPTELASRPRASRAFTTAASAGSACRASSTSSTPTRRTTAAAGTDAGLGYRILYIAPELVSAALGGRALPFVADPVQRPAPELASLLADVDEPIDELGAAEIATTVADLLVERAEGLRPRAEPSTSARWSARASTSPRTQLSRPRRQTRGDRRHRPLHAHAPLSAGVRHEPRPLPHAPPPRARAERRVERGRPLARAAAEAGFADQSHLTRQFKRSYGLTPARWARLTAPAADRRPAG